METAAPPGQAEPVTQQTPLGAPEPLNSSPRAPAPARPSPAPQAPSPSSPSQMFLSSCSVPFVQLRDSGSSTEGQQGPAVPNPHGQDTVLWGLSTSPLWQGRVDPHPVLTQ